MKLPKKFHALLLAEIANTIRLADFSDDAWEEFERVAGGKAETSKVYKRACRMGFDPDEHVSWRSE